MLNLNLANQIISISEAKNVTFSNSFIEESTFTIRGTPNDSQSRVEFRNTRMSDVTWRAMLVNNIVVRDQSDIDLKISGKDSQNLKTFCCSTTLNVSSNSNFTDDVFPGKSCDDCKKRDAGQNFEKMINATNKNDRKFKCPVCHQMFAVEMYMENHMRQMHGITKAMMKNRVIP